MMKVKREDGYGTRAIGVPFLEWNIIIEVW